MISKRRRNRRQVYAGVHARIAGRVGRALGDASAGQVTQTVLYGPVRGGQRCVRGGMLQCLLLRAHTERTGGVESVRLEPHGMRLVHSCTARGHVDTQWTPRESTALFIACATPLKVDVVRVEAVEEARLYALSVAVCTHRHTPRLAVRATILRHLRGIFLQDVLEHEHL